MGCICLVYCIVFVPVIKDKTKILMFSIAWDFFLCLAISKICMALQLECHLALCVLCHSFDLDQSLFYEWSFYITLRQICMDCDVFIFTEYFSLCSVQVLLLFLQRRLSETNSKMLVFSDVVSVRFPYFQRLYACVLIFHTFNASKQVLLVVFDWCW